MQTSDMLIRLGIALVLGGLIGYEREKASQPAGLRTHMILILGSWSRTDRKEQGRGNKAVPRGLGPW